MTGPNGADPQVAAYIAERAISEILHFTTSHGLIGPLQRRLADVLRHRREEREQ